MNTIFTNNSTVLFQGDSITDWGRIGGYLPDFGIEGEPLGSGYVYRAAKVYELLFPQNQIHFVNRALSGNRVRDLLARYEADFEAVKPDYLSIMIGINDTWRKYDSQDPTSAEEFEDSYRTILERFKSTYPHAKIMLIEPFLIPTDPAKEIYWEDLNPKIQVVRKLAIEFADVYLPMNGIFTNCIQKGIKPEELSDDGVHLTDLGNAIMAREYLAAWATIA